MSNITMKELLEAGVHFGHQTKRWNPKMKPYIFGARNGIYIIDLQKTVRLFKNAYNFVVEATKAGETVLFVGTKKQAQDSVAEEAQRCGMFYVNQRWLGGMLTNFATVKQSIDRLKRLDSHGCRRLHRGLHEEGSAPVGKGAPETGKDPWRYQGDDQTSRRALCDRPEKRGNRGIVKRRSWALRWWRLLTPTAIRTTSIM